MFGFVGTFYAQAQEVDTGPDIEQTAIDYENVIAPQGMVEIKNYDASEAIVYEESNLQPAIKGDYFKSFGPADVGWNDNISNSTKQPGKIKIKGSSGGLPRK